MKQIPEVFPTRARIRRQNDIQGPYRWCHVVLIEGDMCLGSIYVQQGDLLTRQQCEELVGMCSFAKYDVEWISGEV